MVHKSKAKQVRDWAERKSGDKWSEMSRDEKLGWINEYEEEREE